MREKRKNPVRTEEEMYKLPSINEFIKKERRHDELDRLREVKEQKRVWEVVVTIAELVIVGLLILAYIGYKTNA